MKPGFCLTAALFLLALSACKPSPTNRPMVHENSPGAIPGIAPADNSNVNPTGTWKVKVLHGKIQTIAKGTTMVTGAEGTNPQTLHAGGKLDAAREEILRLKLDAVGLTGTLGRTATVNGKSSEREQALAEAKLQGSEISFTVIFPVQVGSGPGATTKYQGTITGDTIKGTLVEDWRGNIFKKEWAAVRVTE